jgi:histidinol-phosphate aminotransferase
MSEYTAHIQNAKILLNANESPKNLPADLRKEIANKIEQIDFNRYPEDSLIALRTAAAKLYGFLPEQIMAGNGSDQMLQLLINTYVKPQGTLVSIAPDFGMYDFYAGQIGAEVIKLQTNPDGSFSIEELAGLAKENQAGLVLFSNPNNPTGHAVSKEKIKKLADAIAPIKLCADEAYMDFCDQSALEYIDSTPNLFITKTLSKAWAAAACRTGFLIGSAKEMERLETNKIVYSVSTLDSTAAIAIMAHPELEKERVKEILQEKALFLNALKTLPVNVIPSSANFVAVSCKKQEENEALENCLAKEGIAVRTFADHKFMRITIGSKEQMETLVNAMKAFFEGKEQA